MNTRHLANQWGLSLEETAYRMEMAGVYAISYDTPIDDMGMNRLRNRYPELFMPGSSGQSAKPPTSGGASKPPAAQPAKPPTGGGASKPPAAQSAKPSTGGGASKSHASKQHASTPVDPAKQLEIYAREFQCIMTASSLLAPFGVEFLDQYSAKCMNTGSSLRPVILYNTVLELVEIARSNDDVAAGHAHAVVEKLYAMSDTNGILWFDYHATSERAALKDVMVNVPPNMNVLILTQQPDYFKDLKDAGLHIGKDEATGRRIYIMRVGASGTLEKLNDKGRQFQFPSATVVTTLSTDPLPISLIPGIGDMVYTSAGVTYELKEACGNPGTEGAVYKVSDRYAAKIYKQGVMNPQRLEKLKRMTAESDRFNRNGVCWPIELLYNANREAVGYLMALATPPPGKKLYELSSAMILCSIMRKFPDWNRKSLIQLCITILEKMAFLHKANVILGDINERNFLFADENTVFFVDCDSYQISELPCPVGVEEYVAPEIHLEKGRFDVLRTMGNENFAVATLLFRLLMLGKRPYDLTDGEDTIADILNADFAYPLGPDTNRRAPEGPYRYVWSQMPYFLKELFYYTFKSPENCAAAAAQSGGESDYQPQKSRYAPEKRPSSAEWLKKMKYYLKMIDTMPDDQAAALCPERFKRVTKICRNCGDEVPAQMIDDNGICRNCRENSVHCKLCGQYKKAPKKYKVYQICQDCLEIEETYPCATPGCDETLSITNFQKYIRGKTKNHYKYCQACQEARKRTYATRRCTCCGNPFDITYGEKSSFEAKGHDLPKRCPDCRKQGRHAAPAASETRAGTQAPNARITFTTGQPSSQPSGRPTGSKQEYSGSRSLWDLIKNIFT